MSFAFINTSSFRAVCRVHESSSSRTSRSGRLLSICPRSTSWPRRWLLRRGFRTFIARKILSLLSIPLFVFHTEPLCIHHLLHLVCGKSRNTRKNSKHDRNPWKPENIHWKWAQNSVAPRHVERDESGGKRWSERAASDVHCAGLFRGSSVVRI